MKRNILHFVVAAAAVVGALTEPAVGQDATKGQVLFKQRCAVCHVTEAVKKSTIGPNLSGVIGRRAGTRVDFNYSPSLKKAPITWSRQKLDTYLAGPANMVPGTRMPVTVPVPKDRADIVAFIATLKAK